MCSDVFPVSSVPVIDPSLEKLPFMMTNALDILVEDTESDPKLGSKYEFRIAFIAEHLPSYLNDHHCTIIG